MWQAIPDGGDLPGKMSGYYQFLASGLSNAAVVRCVSVWLCMAWDMRSQPPLTHMTATLLCVAQVWLEPYQDALGLGLVTTAAIAAYDHTVSPKVRAVSMQQLDTAVRVLFTLASLTHVPLCVCGPVAACVFPRVARARLSA